MSDLERQLKAIPTAKPDDDHELRMNRLFLESPRRRSLLQRPIPLWLAVAGCVLAIAGGFFLKGRPDVQVVQPTGTVHTVYFIPATPEFRRALETGGASRPKVPASSFYIIEVAPFDESTLIKKKEAI